MNFDLSKPILDLNGEPLSMGDRDLSVKSAISDALMRQYDSEVLTGEAKLSRYSLAMEVHTSNGSIDLKAEDIVLIKQVACLAYSPLVYGRICETIDEN